MGDINKDDSDTKGGNITTNMFCADTDNETACYGDSGGPVAAADIGTLIGVVSWGPNFDCELGYPEVFARVGTAREFIDNHLDASDRT